MSLRDRPLWRVMIEIDLDSAQPMHPSYALGLFEAMAGVRWLCPCGHPVEEHGAKAYSRRHHPGKLVTYSGPVGCSLCDCPEGELYARITPRCPRCGRPMKRISTATLDDQDAWVWGCDCSPPT